MFKKSDASNPLERTTGKKPTSRPTDLLRSQEPTPIGPSMHIKGHIVGRQDLVVHGHIEGSIDIGDGLLTVTGDGQVDADVNARVIHVEGRVEGRLEASEQIIVRRSASVRGSLKAPRIALDFGCSFSGSIDTQETRIERAATRDAKIADFKSAICGSGTLTANPAVSKASPR